MANDYSLNNRTGNSIYSRSSFNTETRTGSGSSSGSLSEGSRFHGQVTNITPNSITLKTESGKELIARYSNNTELSIGDNAKFVVTSNDNGVITIRPEGEKSMAGGSDPRLTNAVIKALENADLASTKENVRMIETMLKYNMPVGKEALASMLKNVHKYPGSDPAAIITMMRNGIPVNADNIAQFENYMNLNGQLTEYMGSVTEELLSLVDNLITEETFKQVQDTKVLTGFIKEIFTQFNAESLEEALPSVTDAGSAYTGEGVTLTLSEDAAKDQKITSQISQETAGKAGAEQAVLSETPSVLNEETFLFDTETELIDPAKLLKAMNESQMTEKPVIAGYTISEEEAEDFLQFLMHKGEYTLFSGNDVPTISDLASATLQVQEGLSGSELKEMFTHPVFKKLIDNLISKNWTLDLNKPINEKTVKNLYERIYKGLDKLQESAAKLGGGSTDFSNVVNNVKQNINFMNDLNTVYSYIQLPVSMTNGNKSGELYVFTDKKRLKNGGDGTLSCMLHLDMTNLGRTDVYITLKGDDVTAKFKIDDKKSAALISSHLDELDRAIDFHGYRLNAGVLKEDEKLEAFDFVNSFIDREAPPVKVQRYTFDVRA